MERLRAPAELPSLTGFREFVDRSAAAAGAGPELLLKIELVLEELLVNHVMHAYGSGKGDSEVACYSGRRDGSALKWSTRLRPL